MAENLAIDLTKSKKEIYEELLIQFQYILSEDDPVISNLSNFTAILKDCFPKISWVGFYLYKNDKLYLGPFQGKLACVEIKIGSGVCGASAEKLETIIVQDVDKFPGHIACDSGSKSEIVLPVIVNNKLWGVLDLDSYEYSSFNEIDKEYLEKLIDILVSKGNFNSLELI